MQQKSELSEGWFEVTLDDISIKITDGTHHSPPNSSEGDFKYITAKNIKNNGIDLKNLTFVSSEVHNEIYSRCNPEYGDLLLIKDGATTGIVTLNNLIEPFSMLSSVALLKFPENISNKYIMYYMRSPDFQSNVLDQMGGAAITRLTLKKISSMVVALPPLPEQHRIVSAIEALFARLDATNEKLDRVPEILKTFRESVLAAACEGKLTEEWRENNFEIEDVKISVANYCKKTESKKKSKTSLNNGEEQRYSVPNGEEQRYSVPNGEEQRYSVPYMWATEYLENFIDIAGRIGWKGLKAEEYRDEGPFLLSAHNLSSSKYVDFSSANHVSEERYFESPEIMLKNEDILLVKDGSGIGKIGIVKDLPQEATVNSSLLVIHPSEIILTEFLYYQLSGPEMQNLVKQRITGSATPHLFQKDIKKFLLKIPPLPEQQEIVRRVDALFTFADSIEAKVKAAREKTEKLRQSTLAKAFSGELVETEAEIARREGRDYEKAEVLIERIKEGKKKEETKK